MIELYNISINYLKNPITDKNYCLAYLRIISIYYNKAIQIIPKNIKKYSQTAMIYFFINELFKLLSYLTMESIKVKFHWHTFFCTI